MKINVIVNGKIGVMNLTHSTFIVEDLKAHICKKIGLDVDSYKLKIDFNGDSIELVQTKSNPSFSPNQQKTNDVYGTDSVPNFLMDDKSKETLENFRVFLSSIGSTFYFNETNNPNSTKSYTVNTGVTFFKKLSFTYRFYIFDKMGELVGVVNESSEAHTTYLENIEKIILAKVKQKFPKETDFVSVKPLTHGKFKILVYFKDDGWSRPIAYYSKEESDFNNPLDPQLELRRSVVYKILRPYLGGN